MLCSSVDVTPAAAPLHDGTPVMASAYRQPSAAASNFKHGAAPGTTAGSPAVRSGYPAPTAGQAGQWHPNGPRCGSVH